jgi:hypothetical protein
MRAPRLCGRKPLGAHIDAAATARAGLASFGRGLVSRSSYGTALPVSDRMRASRNAARKLSLRTTNDSEVERRADALAFPGEEQRDPGECLLDSGQRPTAELDYQRASPSAGVQTPATATETSVSSSCDRRRLAAVNSPRTSSVPGGGQSGGGRGLRSAMITGNTVYLVEPGLRGQLPSGSRPVCRRR